MAAHLRSLPFAALLLTPLAFAAPPVERLRLPPGFSIGVFAADVPSARQMALGSDGTVFVGSTKAGKVYALTDADHDGRAETVRTIASGLTLPSGIAFRDGALYVGALERILRFDAIEARLDAPPAPIVVTATLPDDRHHGWRYLGFGPDGKLYVPIGAPCNVCDKPGYAKLVRMNVDGSGVEDVALGIRNTVGFDWQPKTGALWFTDNGRDMLGDDLPSDELNRVAKTGAHFGFPYCHQGDTLDPEFGNGKDCKTYTPPAAKLGAHVAAIGMRFYAGTAFPAPYRGAALIAEHGSWNRSAKVGYRVVAVPIAGDRAQTPIVLVDGFLDGDTAWGRPSDVQPLPDGSLLIADDAAGAVYRVSYSAPKR